MAALWRDAHTWPRSWIHNSASTITERPGRTRRLKRTRTRATTTGGRGRRRGQNEDEDKKKNKDDDDAGQGGVEDSDGKEDN